MPFYVKNIPKLVDVSLSSYTPLESEEIRIVGTMQDQDKTKYVYIYVQAGEEPIQIVGILQSDGTSKSFNLPFIAQSTFGSKLLKIWASDQSNPSNKVSDFDSCEPITKSITVTYLPILNCMLNDDDIVESNKDVTVKVEVKDDTSVSILFDFDNTRINEMTKSISCNNVMKEEFIDFKIPENSKYGRHTLKVSAVDEFNKIAEFPFEKSIYIINKPVLSASSIEKSELFMEEISKILITLNDKDDGKKLYFFARIDPYDAFKLGELKSKGAIDTQLSFTYKAPTDIGTGRKTIYVWAQDFEDWKATPKKNTKSETRQIELTIKYRPSVLVEFPSDDTQYNDGGKIHIKGTITSNSKSTLMLRIDDLELKSQNKEFEMDQNGQQKFDIEVQIPDTIKYGRRFLYVKVKDETANVESVEKGFKFFMRNNPSISDVTITSHSALQGSHIQIKGKVNDPDDKNKLQIKVRIGDNANNEFVLKDGIISNTKLQDFEGELKIPENATVGTTKLYVYAIDEDGLMSNEQSFDFEITAKTNNNAEVDIKKGNGNKNTGLIAGIVIGVMIIIIIVIVVAVISIKKKGQSKDEDTTEQPEMEPEEQETIANQVSNETNTVDNPLFTENKSIDNLFDMNPSDNEEIEEIDVQF